MEKKFNVGTIIAGLGTLCSIAGMVIEKYTQNKTMKQTIIEEVAKAINKE